MSRPDLVAEIALIPEHRRFGRITGVMGMTLEAGGLPHRPGVGGQCSVLRSVSRTMPGCNSAVENAVVAAARAHLATYEDMAELIRLGAYKRGTDAKVDEAINRYPLIEAFLAQGKTERADLASGYAQLAALSAAPR